MPNDPDSCVHWLQLWFSRVAAASRPAEERVLDWLSPSELRRLQGFGRERRRREYLLSRALMRHALQRQFQRAEADWRFAERGAAPPRVSGLPQGTHLSLSHSGGYICFAIASCAVGVDIEASKPGRDYAAAAEWFMDDAERAQLRRRQATRAEYFYRLWCAKEACFKALTPAQQAQTSLRAISHAELLSDRDDRQLIEGDGGEFRMAAVVAASSLRIEQASFLQPIAVTFRER
jgi:phosphopantetheine--protein transferase-like protein